jgi:hypothetical protein
MLLVLAGCSASPRVPTEAKAPQELRDYERLEQWLLLQRQVAAMTDEEVKSALDSSSSRNTPEDVFYSALLNQRMDAYGNWTLARDLLRELRDEPALTTQQRQLASILERYNQSRINWYMKRELLEDQNLALESENEVLRDELAAAEAERSLLEEKIQAITDLETAISTRKE